MACRLSFGSLDAIDIPSEKRQHSSAAFGSNHLLSSRPEQAMAIEFNGASFTWQAHSPGVVGVSASMSPNPRPSSSRGWRSGLVLQDIDLSIPEGKLTVIYGDIGSGKASKPEKGTIEQWLHDDY